MTDHDATEAKWVIVTTKPAAEEVAERALREAGYRVYLPRYRRVMRGHRLAGWRSGTALSMRPAFTGYVFVQDWRGWPDRPINGVIGLMMRAGNRPLVLAPSDIAFILDREIKGRFDDERSPRGVGVQRDDLNIGDQVEFERIGQRIIGGEAI